MVINAINI